MSTRRGCSQHSHQLASYVINVGEFCVLHDVSIGEDSVVHNSTWKEIRILRSHLLHGLVLLQYLQCVSNQWRYHSLALSHHIINYNFWNTCNILWYFNLNTKLNLKRLHLKNDNGSRKVHPTSPKQLLGPVRKEQHFKDDIFKSNSAKNSFELHVCCKFHGSLSNWPM